MMILIMKNENVRYVLSVNNNAITVREKSFVHPWLSIVIFEKI